MRLGGVFGALALAGGCLIGSVALAADWQIATVSGKAYRLDGTDWVRVAASDKLALGDTVKTLGSGSLTLTRDGVTITVAPNSRLQIRERMGGKFTDVMQTAGSAEVEVDPGRRIRLDVVTPYMAAVVKGTVFAVSTFEGYSETAVRRGRVAVIDVTNRLPPDVPAGQSSASGEGRPLSLSSTGTLMTPKAFNGKVVVRRIDGTLTETRTEVPETQTINGAGKTVTSNAGGNGAGKSEASNAGGNSGKGNSSGSNGSASGSNSGNGNSSGNGSGNSGGNGSSSGSNNSGNGSSSSSNSGNGNSGNGNSGNSGNGRSK